jgi:hypothetical protein
VAGKLFAGQKDFPKKICFVGGGKPILLVQFIRA